MEQALKHQGSQQIHPTPHANKLTLRGCLGAGEGFIESSQDIKELKQVVSSWVSYCEDIVP